MLDEFRRLLVNSESTAKKLPGTTHKPLDGSNEGVGCGCYPDPYYRTYLHSRLALSCSRPSPEDEENFLRLFSKVSRRDAMLVETWMDARSFSLCMLAFGSDMAPRRTDMPPEMPCLSPRVWHCLSRDAGCTECFLSWNPPGET
jgi:hypothetical protein